MDDQRSDRVCWGDTNLYAYVFNDPVNGIDPSGLFLNLVAGCLISGGIELAAQMIIDGKSLGCVDWGSVVSETLMGCNPFAKGLKAGKAAKGLKCAANSLVAGTLVHTEEGLVPIEWVKVGEKVLSWDERTGETSYRPVLELIQHEGTYELVKVTLENGEQLEATSGHPFYIQGKGWNAAANLKVGDALLLYNGMTLVVKTVDSRVGWERVYNFSVAQNANYFVGSGGVGVHNAKCYAGGGASLDNIPEYVREWIERFVDKYNIEVTVVGSRAKGTTHAMSDFDYILGKNTGTMRKKARRELPKGQGGGELIGSKWSGQDFLDGPVRENDPYIRVVP